MDVVVLLASFGLAVVLRALMAVNAGSVALTRLDASLHNPSYASFLAWFIVAYLFVARRSGLYNPSPAGTALHEVRIIVQACLTAGLLLLGALYLFRGNEISRALMILLMITSSGLLCGRRELWRRSRFRQYRAGVDVRNVVVLGTNPLSLALARYMQSHIRLGCRFVGFIDGPKALICDGILSDELLGGIDRLVVLARQHFLDELVITDFYPTEEVLQLLQAARELDIDVRTIGGYYGGLTTNSSVEQFGIFPVVWLHRRVSKLMGRSFKRVVDIVVSLAGLFALMPLLLLIAMAIRIDSPGPALYTSERVGKRGRLFDCFKFRTMIPNADQMKHKIAALNERDGILFKCSNDPRVTRVGRFLRKYSLDELPQLLNVLRGEMSLVGPRPPIASEVEKYELEHLRRLEVLPGLTGLWQVHARTDPSFAKYIELDTAYVENWSFWLDVKIMMRTAGVVLQGTGV